MNTTKHILEFQPVIVTVISAIFLLLLLMHKDELEQLALNNALKLSTIITTISLFGYSLYKLSLGLASIDINIIFFAIEGICIMTLLFYYLYLKGIGFEIKIKNSLLSNILMYCSIIISIVATISMIFEFRFFDNKDGYIRYDEMILFANVILISIITPLLPRRKKVNHKQYKIVKKEIDRTFNLMWLIYSIIMVLIISYIFYQKIITK
ncbi:hypothetical protein PV797_03605 [Clostridiaceae bacterium M8S5]|nr:hypothetical protein PV797_03605 [Clostridiaceae bacterium M8S5]